MPGGRTFMQGSMQVVMSTVMLMRWPEVSKRQYDQARKEIKWESETPQRAKFHVAGLARGRFLKQRLVPGVQKIGTRANPEVQFAEVHAVFAPNV